MIYIYAFLIGGAICGLAEIIKCFTKLTMGHMTVLFVCLGTLLDFGNLYDKMLEKLLVIFVVILPHIFVINIFALVIIPITNFGHSLVHASLEKANKDGFIGIFTGIFDKTSAGIAFTIFIAVLFSFIFRPKK